MLLLLLLFFLSPRIPDFLGLTPFTVLPPRNHHRHQLPHASENAIILFRALGVVGAVLATKSHIKPPDILALSTLAADWL